jgi:predicted peroxiredoxin
MTRVVYFNATGPQDPTRASLGLHLAANGSAELGHEIDVVLVGDATDLVRGSTIDTIQGVGVPSLRELVDKAIAKGVRFHV